MEFNISDKYKHQFVHVLSILAVISKSPKERSCCIFYFRANICFDIANTYLQQSDDRAFCYSILQEKILCFLNTLFYCEVLSKNYIYRHYSRKKNCIRIYPKKHHLKMASLYLGIRLPEKPFERLKLTNIDLITKNVADLKVETEKLLNFPHKELGK